MKDRKEIQVRACELARSLLASDTEYLERIIELRKIGSNLYGECWDTEFHVFGVIESDTDHLPISIVREHCSKAMLEKTDKEIEGIINFYRVQVNYACNSILAKYENV